MIIVTLSLASRRRLRSPSCMRISRFSLAVTRSASRGGRALFSPIEGGGHRLDARVTATLGEIVEFLARRAIAEFGGGQGPFLFQFRRLGADFRRPRVNALSMDMPYPRRSASSLAHRETSHDDFDGGWIWLLTNMIRT